MSKVDETATNAKPGRGRTRGLRFWMIVVILPLAVTVIGGATGYWYFFLRGHTEVAQEQVAEPELPLPFYLEIKPFVISMVNGGGTPHFVQLGLNLTLSGSTAGNVVMAVLPEIQDAIRQTALGFKVDDIVTPAGIDKLREAMIAGANRALLRRIGAERVKRLSGGEPNGGVVQNIYFTTLVVE